MKRGGVISGMQHGNGSTPPADLAFRSLLRTFGLLRRVMEPYFGKYGISGAHWGVLVTLHRAEEEGHESLRLVDLSERLIVRPPSMTSVVDRLQRMSLVGRAASPTDQRAKLVRLTAKGRALVARILEGHGERTAQLLGGLNEAEQGDLHGLLERMANHLDEMARHEEAVPAR